MLRYNYAMSNHDQAVSQGYFVFVFVTGTGEALDTHAACLPACLVVTEEE